MGLVMRPFIAIIVAFVWSFGPAISEPMSSNARLKQLSSKLGIGYGKRQPANSKRISIGEFLERLKPMMKPEQYAKFAKYIAPHKDKELPSTVIEANKVYLQEGSSSFRLEVSRNPEALIAVAGVAIPNADFEDVDAALNKIEALFQKDQKTSGLMNRVWSQIFPEADAWLWPIAIVAAAGLFGYFLYKGLSNINVEVGGGTTHEVTGGTTHEVIGGTNHTVGGSVDTNHNLNIFSTGGTK